VADLKKVPDGDLFKAYIKTKDVRIRNELVERYLYVAQIIAKKFVGRGVDYEDLYQAASLALVRAIERFDPEREVKFTSFATPSLIGELKNYFRDQTRLLRVPRRDGELLKKVNNVISDYTVVHGNSPKPAEIAEKLNLPLEKVMELLELKNAGNVVSLDSAMAGGDDEDFQLMNTLGENDAQFDRIENKDFLEYCLKLLNDEEKQIILERFVNNKTQKQVADLLGVSQMQISRMERKILSKLKSKV
jgi:RNA polymerase sigma factor, sigma-70 family